MDFAFYTMIVLVLSATWLDFQTHKIPNWLTFGGMMLGMIASTFFPSFEGSGPTWSLLGVATGLLLFLPIYAFGKMGAGDVKLLAMVGAFLGPAGVFSAGIISVLAGGVLAVSWVIYQISFTPLIGEKPKGKLATSQLNEIDSIEEPAFDANINGALKSQLPYGCAIATGAIAAYLMLL